MKNGFWYALLLFLPLLAQAGKVAGNDFARIMALTPDEQHGRELFEKCAACHKADGGGTADGAIPRIAGQHYRVLVRQLADFRSGARWDVRMEGVATSHEIIPELQDIADVARYVSGMSHDGARGVGDGEYVALGQALYAKSCASCHGSQAEGNAKDTPRLAGQHAPYLARQLYDAIDGRRPHLERSHGKRFQKLEYADVLGLTDYLSRIGWSGDDAPPAPEH